MYFLELKTSTHKRKITNKSVKICRSVYKYVRWRWTGNQPFKKIFTLQQSKTMDKKHSGLFDITIGAFDGAEVCEFAGSFVLS